MMAEYGYATSEMRFGNGSSIALYPCTSVWSSSHIWQADTCIRCGTTADDLWRGVASLFPLIKPQVKRGHKSGRKHPYRTRRDRVRYQAR